MKKPDPGISKLKDALKLQLEKSGLKARIEPQLARYRALDADKRQQVQTGLVFAVIAANLLLVMAPLLTAFIDLRQKIQKVSSEVQIARHDIDAKAQMAEALAAAERATQETERRTFKTNEVHQFLDLLSDMAKASNVRIESLTPLPVKGSADEMPRTLPKGYSLAGFELLGQAGYHEFGRFVASLESGVPFVKVESVDIYHETSQSRTVHQVKLRFLLIQRS